jgi:hypothetical protein
MAGKKSITQHLMIKFMKNYFTKIDINGNKKRQVVIISYDNNGNLVMKEMSQTRYFLFKVMKKVNTKNNILAIAIAGLFVFMFSDDFVRGVKNFPERFASALEVSQECDNGISECQWNTRKK